MPLTRRQLIVGMSAAATPVALGGCGGFSTNGGGSDANASSESGKLTFTTWGTDAELAGFRSAIKGFQDANPGTTVALNSVPYDQMFTNIDAQLQAGTPPDIFRVPYYTFGNYAGRGQLLDLSSHLDKSFADRFTPQAWAAVQNDGKPFGVPHHTDTTAILYDVKAMTDAGITGIPKNRDEAWTWQEFADVAARLRKRLPSSKYPFAYNWQGNGVTRWLTWLFEADGRFLADDLITPAIDSDAGRKAIDFTTKFFRDGLVPRTNSTKSATYAADSWLGQTVPMVFGGAFLVPEAQRTLKRQWAVTFPPLDVRAASDFGGNALVATARTGQPGLAAKFLDFVTTAEPMRKFCAGSSLLPTRTDLVKDGIEFDVRPDVSRVFIEQASTVLPQDSSQVASPDMSKIITVMKNELENAFVGGQDTKKTLKALASGISSATK